MNIVIVGEYLFSSSIEAPDSLTWNIIKLKEINKIVI